MYTTVEITNCHMMEHFVSRLCHHLCIMCSLFSLHNEILLDFVGTFVSRKNTTQQIKHLTMIIVMVQKEEECIIMY